MRHPKPKQKPPADADEVQYESKITPENADDELLKLAYKTLEKSMQDPDWTGPGKVALGVAKMIRGEDGKGTTNNFYLNVINMPTEELRRLKELAEAPINTITIESGGGGALPARNRRKSAPVPALLGAKVHQDV